MSRHLAHTKKASWRTVLGSLFSETAWGVGSWLTLAVLALIPALVARGLWLMAVAEPFTDEAAATLSANVAGVVTWVGGVAGVRRFFRRRRRVGRHAAGVSAPRS